jgi:hypothetical protein
VIRRIWRILGFGTVACLLPVMQLVAASSASARTAVSTPTVESSTVGMSLYVEPAPGQYDPTGSSSAFLVDANSPLRFGVWTAPDFPGEAVDVRIVLLLDYQPFPFVLAPMDPAGTPPADGPNGIGPGGPSIDLRLPTNAETAFAVETAPVPAGYHDFALVVVTDPDRPQMELSYSTSFRTVMRLSVYAGADATPPVLDLEPLDADAATETELTELAAFADRPDATNMERGSTVEAGGSDRVFLRLVPYPQPIPAPGDDATPAFGGSFEEPVVLVAFLGDRVVPLNGEPYLLGTLRPGHINTVEIDIPAPSRPDAEQFFVQVFPNPFQDADAVYAAGRSLFSVQPLRLTVGPRVGP